MAAINLSQYGMDFIFDPAKGIDAIPEDCADRVSKISIDKKRYTFTSRNGFKNVYTLGTEIGSGSFGSVYHCKREGNIKPMAIKIKSNVDVMNLIKESLIQIIICNKTHGFDANGIKGPFAPEIFDVGYNTLTKEYCIVSEYIEDTVRNVLLGIPIVDTEASEIFILNVLIQTSYMLSYLYSTLRFNHRDFKSDNIMMSRIKGGYVRVYLIDFGHSCLNYDDLIIEGNDGHFNECSVNSRDLTQFLYELNFSSKHKLFNFSDKFNKLIVDLLTVQRGDKICNLTEGCEGIRKWENTYSFLNVKDENPNCKPEVIINILDSYLKNMDYSDKLPFSRAKVHETMKDIFLKLKNAQGAKSRGRINVIGKLTDTIFKVIENRYIDLMYLKPYSDGSLRSTNNTYKDALFVLAASYGLDEIVDLLLKEGAEIDKRFSGDDNFINGTALIVAVRNNQLTTIKFLLAKNAGIDKIDGKRNYPLLVAIQERNIPVIQLLLNAGADINFKGGLMSPLMKVAEIGSGDILDVLFSDGATVDINMRSSSGSTALFVACSFGNLEIVEKLIELGADINIPNHFNGSPLMIAIKNGHDEVANTLLSAKPNLDILDENKESALFIATETKNKDMVLELLMAGAKTDLVNRKGQTVASIATVPEIQRILSAKKGGLRKTVRDRRCLRKTRSSRKSI